MNVPWSRRERLVLPLAVVAGILWLFSGPLFGDRCVLSVRPDDPRLNLRPWAAGDPARQEAANPITPDIDGFVLPGMLRAQQLEDQVGDAHWDGGQLLGYPLAANIPWPFGSPLAWGLPRLVSGLTGEPLDGIDLLDTMLALHLAIALFLAYRAARLLGAEPAFATVGAVGFAFSTWMATRWHAPQIVMTTAWWPGQLGALAWLALGHKRRAIVEGGLITAMLLLSGFPQVGTVLTGLTVLIALGDGRLRSPRALAGLAAAIVLGLALAAPQLALNASAYEHCLRSEPEVQAAVAERGLPPASLIGALLPRFFGHPPDFSGPSRPADTMETWLPQRLWWSHQIQNSVVENALYPGVILLLLLGLALTRAGSMARWLVLIAALTVLGTIVAPWVVEAVPAARGLAAGSVKRALVLLAGTLPLAGALALQALAEGRARTPWRWGLVLLACVAVAPLAVLLLDDPDAPRFAAMLGSQALRQGGLIVVGLIALLLIRRYGRWLPGWQDPDEQAAAAAAAADQPAEDRPPPPAWQLTAPDDLPGLIPPAEPEPDRPDPVQQKELDRGRGDLATAARLVRWLPALILTVDLVGLAGAFNPFPRQVQEPFPSTPALEFLAQRPGRVAALGPEVTLLPPTAGVLHGIRFVHGIAPMVPTRTAELLACIEGPLLDMRDPRVAEPFERDESLSHPLLDLLGVRSVVHADPELAVRVGLDQVYASEAEGLAVLDRPTAGPRAFLAGGALVVPETERRLARLADRTFAGHRTVLLEAAPQRPLPEQGPPGVVAVDVLGSDGDLSLAVEAPFPGVVVLTEAWDPGWSASLDGEPVPVLHADHALMGVEVDAGAHEIVFRYEPPGLVLAGWVRWIALAVALFLAVTVVRFRIATARHARAWQVQEAQRVRERQERDRRAREASLAEDAARPKEEPPLHPPAIAQVAPELGCFEGHGVTIIIPAYDDTPKLRRALWSIRTTTDLPYELIVSRAKQCVAKNRNAGLARATQELIVFLDDDVLLTPGWLSRLVAVLGSRDDLGAVSAYLTFADGSPQTRRPDLRPGDFWEITIPGTCFVYSRRRVRDLGFDENYQGSQWEDTDWMWQVQRMGLTVGMTGDVWVVHDHADSENRWLVVNGEYFRGKWGRLPDPDDNVAITPEQYAAWEHPPLPGSTHAEDAERRLAREFDTRTDVVRDHSLGEDEDVGALTAAMLAARRAEQDDGPADEERPDRGPDAVAAEGGAGPADPSPGSFGGAGASADWSGAEAAADETAGPAAGSGEELEPSSVAADGEDDERLPTPADPPPIQLEDVPAAVDDDPPADDEAPADEPDDSSSADDGWDDGDDGDDDDP